MEEVSRARGPSARRIVSAMLICLLALGAVAVASRRAAASGGGGCGRPVTDETGSRVTIRNFCFGPTVLRTSPGAVVTFRNADSVPHTVLGANGSWGSFGTVHRGQDVSYRFERAGVYPYVCTYHPGMVGVVVVGNAGGPGAVGTSTANGPVVAVTPGTSPAATHAPAIVPMAAPSVWWPGGAGVAIGLLLATVVVASVKARRARRRTA